MLAQTESECDIYDLKIHGQNSSKNRGERNEAYCKTFTFIQFYVGYWLSPTIYPTKSIGHRKTMTTIILLVFLFQPNISWTESICKTLFVNTSLKQKKHHAANFSLSLTNITMSNTNTVIIVLITYSCYISTCKHIMMIRSKTDYSNMLIP